MKTFPAPSTAAPVGKPNALVGMLCAPAKLTLCPRAAIGERHNRMPPTSASGFWKIVVTTRNQGPGKCFMMFLPLFQAIFCGRVFLWIISTELSRDARFAEYTPIYGVEPVSQTVVEPAPGNGVRVRSSSCRPDFVGANSIRKRCSCGPPQCLPGKCSARWSGR